MPNENILKISNSTRIARILQRICQANLPVIVRELNDSSVAVKGRASSLTMDPSNQLIRISNISDKGIQHLHRPHAKIQVEFVMMSTKVLFVTQLVSIDANSITLMSPSVLVSVERRKNARYSTTDALRAMIHLSLWTPSHDDLTAPPVFAHAPQLANFIQIADLSYGGLCAVTRFPSVNSVIRRGLIDEKAKLILPMQQPFDVSVEIRWIKKIREHVSEYANKQVVRSYRFGLEFVRQSEEVRVAVHQFIQQISQADAI